ncbi:MAG: hypothetical protein MPJ52_00865 [Alphaproteobacteria bacterium]|nr:hypothetical protein [Alphaproteobacteria bacterium]
MTVNQQIRASAPAPRALEKGQAAAITEQVFDLFLDDNPPILGGIGALLNIDDKDADLLWDLAVGLHRQGRFPEAESVFSRLCRLQGFAQPRNYKALGAARQRQSRWKEATAAYEMAAVLSRSDPEPSFYAAECLRRLGLRDRSRDALKASILLSGDDEQHAALKKRAEALLADSGDNNGDGDNNGVANRDKNGAANFGGDNNGAAVNGVADNKGDNKGVAKKGKGK